MNTAERIITENANLKPWYLLAIAEPIAVDEDQDWDNEKTTYFFEDGSAISVDSFDELCVIFDGETLRIN